MTTSGELVLLLVCYMSYICLFLKSPCCIINVDGPVMRPLSYVFAGGLNQDSAWSLEGEFIKRVITI